MEEEVLALGQREIDATTGITSFSDEELKLVSDSGLTVDKLIGFVTETGRQTINAAIGGVKEFELPKESNAPPTVEGEFIEHVVTEEDLKMNPGLETEVKVGDTVEIPMMEDSVVDPKVAGVDEIA